MVMYNYFALNVEMKLIEIIQNLIALVFLNFMKKIMFASLAQQIVYNAKILQFVLSVI